ncbi:helix-turn-helix domain-containing protein [Mycolicibacterium fortuitum]|uniref:LysR family transcriptional regulator n=2 Tax=Mycolicibacterium fortuitum TaxID=1766 RepID=A0AAE4VAH0_MYCFO|nr:LysR family transcriptional regulator [Mycolicibacterium fortuitum]MDV7191270.1 LysR family transcriptional regulator [Mycolicibacterium fortuitum]MDV7205083.1 LysR family transcriptional regulator [Mycolicibacterium fortuitum]MDV7225379.1 LysR family transcriptional regulator [Mycolicibacterium fortuitum]MDV7282602.1 LysR family transcriptional regulator [Mycolicibacterium fortuitum]MDV7290783.1 LysR family transcriptional regulator [Mycolicibacterium fortuitum]
MLLADLADLGSVTAVAEHRNITSSAVSQQLRVLEDETGAALFRRDGRTLGSRAAARSSPSTRAACWPRSTRP